MVRPHNGFRSTRRSLPRDFDHRVGNVGFRGPTGPGNPIECLQGSKFPQSQAKLTAAIAPSASPMEYSGPR
jgi:hypothetical protein